MSAVIKHLSRVCLDDYLGLACLFAWVYVTLFGCGLSTSPFVFFGLEHFWSATGLVCAVAGIAALIAVGNIKSPTASVWSMVAPALAIIGSFSIWLGYFDHNLFWVMRIVCGLFSGTAFIMMTVFWYTRLCALDEARIEFAVTAAFALSFILYCVILLLKPSSVAVLVVDALFPVLSSYFLRRSGIESLDGGLTTTSSEKRSALRHYATLLVMIALLWFQIAYFRVLSTPETLGNRFTHFLIAFFCAAVFASVLFIFCLKLSAHLNFTLIVRWPLPLFIVSYVVYFFNLTDPMVRMIAYSVNFLGMFGVQFGCWVSAPKYLKRTKEPPIVMALGVVTAQGVGIFAGFEVAMPLVNSVPLGPLTSASLLIIAIVVGMGMLTAFSPRWYLNGAPQAPLFAKMRKGVDEGAVEEVGTVEGGGIPEGSRLDELFTRQAIALQKTYHLTDRETEVTALLLAGRSRPYIRDELFISANTVNTHVRHIFTKCGVHSQQELLDLVRAA